VILQLPKIYPITDAQVSSLSHAEQVKRLIAGGATFIQLREKRQPARAFYNEAAKALNLARSAGAKLIINDRVDIALALRADGVHLGQTDMPVITARRLLGPHAVIGYSTHNLDQARAALELPIDYLAFGPIFPTRSKDDPDPVAGLDKLRQITSIAAPMPVVAIGGIGQSTLAEVLSAGADAAALISAILSDTYKITENLRDLLARSRNQRS